MAEFTVAIELGSSKITGIAGRKNKDGSISILALAQEDATACIRKGVVYNIEKTVQALSNIIKKLETTLKTRIAHVYVGVGGQSIQSVRNTNVKTLPNDGEVTLEMINELMDANRSMQYPDKQILDAITQEYKVDNQYTNDPVGIQCKRIEGNFLNILQKRNYFMRLKKCFDQANITVLDMFLSPLVMADSVLSDAEKRGGCVLVDLGADTTTVCVYYKNIVRHLAVIPLGSNNITKDIASLQMEEKDAEKMKIKYGSAYTDINDIEKDRTYPIDDERTIEMPKFVEIVADRAREIIENVWNQVPEEFTNKLLGGFVLTGGGCNMRNIERAFRTYTDIDKIRVAKFVNEPIKSNNAIVNAKDGRMCTVLGILAKGDQNCAGNDIMGDLFDNIGEANAAQNANKPANNGRVLDQAETERIKQEELKKKQEEEERKRQQEEEEARRIEEERKRNSKKHKYATAIKSFFKKIVADEEDEK